MHLFRKKFVVLTLMILLFAGTLTNSSYAEDIESFDVNQSAEDKTFNGSFGNSLEGESREIYDTLVETYIDSFTGLSNGYTDGAEFEFEAWKYSYTCEDENDIYSGDSYLEQKEIVMNMASYAYWSFVHDYPEVFWAGDLKVNFKSWVNTEDPTSLYIGRITIVPEEQSEGYYNRIDEYNSSVLSSIESINELIENDSDYARLKAIHDYICDNSRYNRDASNADDSPDYNYAHSSGGFFLRGANQAAIVCDGYSSTFKVLCDYYDIPCVMIFGTGKKEVHMWNYAQIDSNWYAVDVTWDDSTLTDQYFLVGSQTPTEGDNVFSDNHTPVGSQISSNEVVTLVYPELSERSYLGE